MIKKYKDKKWLYYEYVVLEKSAERIGRECGISASTIFRWMKKYGMSRRTLPEARVSKTRSMYNKPLSDKHKASISRAWTPERRSKMSKLMKNRKVSEETRNKLRIAQTGKTLTKEAKAKVSRANKGKILSEETKAKIGAANRGKVFSEESKAKVSRANKGRILSDEHKAKLSKASKGRILSDEIRAKMSEAHKGKVFSKEHKIRLSNAKRGEKNPSFRNWASRAPYCYRWTEEVREYIRNLCNRTCIICGKSILQYHKKEWKIKLCLPVDHLDENKMQGCDDWKWRLTALCPSCHGRMRKQKLPYHLLLRLLLLNNKKHQTNFLFGEE